MSENNDNEQQNLIDLENELCERMARDRFQNGLKFGAMMILAVMFIVGMFMFLPMIPDAVKDAMGVK